jgi:hypothetical protein
MRSLASTTHLPSAEASKLGETWPHPERCPEHFRTFHSVHFVSARLRSITGPESFSASNNASQSASSGNVSTGPPPRRIIHDVAAVTRCAPNPPACFKPRSGAHNIGYVCIASRLAPRGTLALRVQHNRGPYCARAVSHTRTSHASRPRRACNYESPSISGRG